MAVEEDYGWRGGVAGFAVEDVEVVDLGFLELDGRRHDEGKSFWTFWSLMVFVVVDCWCFRRFLRLLLLWMKSNIADTVVFNTLMSIFSLNQRATLTLLMLCQLPLFHRLKCSISRGS